LDDERNDKISMKTPAKMSISLRQPSLEELFGRKKIYGRPQVANPDA
jgi:hypothetical protein